MSRIAKLPIPIPQGVSVHISEDALVTCKGAKGELQQQIHEWVDVREQDGSLQCSPKDANVQRHNAMAGTMRALLANMVVGVHQGFEKKLLINGVGYRAQLSGKVLNLSLGYSNIVNFPLRDGITVEVTTPTELVIRGVSRQVVGQVAAEIRSLRKVEPYRGKGIRYADEHVTLKEVKKK